jgi:hypothetical protein
MAKIFIMLTYLIPLRDRSLLLVHNERLPSVFIEVTCELIDHLLKHCKIDNCEHFIFQAFPQHSEIVPVYTFSKSMTLPS